MWANLCDRQVHHDPGHRGDLESFVAGQQSRIVRELPGIDLAAGLPKKQASSCSSETCKSNVPFSNGEPEQPVPYRRVASAEASTTSGWVARPRYEFVPSNTISPSSAALTVDRCGPVNRG